MAAVRVKLARRGKLEEVREMLTFARPAKLEEVGDAMVTFSSLPQELRLFSAPERPIILRDERDRPQR